VTGVQTCALPILTNDKPLRKASQQQGIKINGTLWIIYQAYERKILSSDELCEWIFILVRNGSRMPAKEISKLRTVMNCSNYGISYRRHLHR